MRRLWTDGSAFRHWRSVRQGRCRGDRSGLNRRPNRAVAVDAEWWARHSRAGVRVSGDLLEPVASPRTNRSRSCDQLQNAAAAAHWSRAD
jgi:hypothetical protein